MADANEALIKALMARPVMPEEFDRSAPLGNFQPRAEAFGAGMIDPMGVPSWLANKTIGSPATDWYERWAQEKRDQSPIAAGMGSAVPLAALGAGGLAARAAGTYAAVGARLPASTPVSLFGTILPGAMVMGSAGGNIRDELAPPTKKQRPQAAYPPDGAY